MSLPGTGEPSLLSPLAGPVARERFVSEVGQWRFFWQRGGRKGEGLGRRRAQCQLPPFLQGSKLKLASLGNFVVSIPLWLLPPENKMGEVSAVSGPSCQFPSDNQGKKTSKGNTVLLQTSTVIWKNLLQPRFYGVFAYSDYNKSIFLRLKIKAAF